MAQLNHTIVRCRDKMASASYLSEMLGLPAPGSFGPFAVVELDNEVSLDFHDVEGTIASQHYAFLVTDEEFAATFERIKGADIEYWADPGQKRHGEVNHNDGGQGLYFEDPDGHLLEIITRPYGSGD